MNADNIRAELRRLRAALEGETDTQIQHVIRHRIADLERELEKLRAEGKDDSQ